MKKVKQTQAFFVYECCHLPHSDVKWNPLWHGLLYFLFCTSPYLGLSSKSNNLYPRCLCLLFIMCMLNSKGWKAHYGGPLCGVTL